MIQDIDLRKGNIITVTENAICFNAGIGPILTIDRLLEQTAFFKEMEHGEFYRDLKGIKLTGEHLVRLGAVNKYGETYFVNRLKFDVNSIGIVRFHYSGKVAYLEYFHELQNLIRAICGDDLVADASVFSASPTNN